MQKSVALKDITKKSTKSLLQANSDTISKQTISVNFERSASNAKNSYININFNEDFKSTAKKEKETIKMTKQFQFKIDSNSILRKKPKALKIQQKCTTIPEDKRTSTSLSNRLRIQTPMSQISNYKT